MKTHVKRFPLVAIFLLRTGLLVAVFFAVSSGLAYASQPAVPDYGDDPYPNCYPEPTYIIDEAGNDRCFPGFVYG
jgi:hypothetical protein